MRRRRGRWLLAALLLVLGYLLLAPTPCDPEAWTPLAPPALAGPYAENARLARVEWLLRGRIDGPEAVAFDRDGRLYTGLRDGRIVRFRPGEDALEVVARTGGRPLGLKFDGSGGLVVADAHRGLLAVGEHGEVSLLASAHGGVGFRFTDDLDIAADGTIYFSDASSRYSIEDYPLDILEHRGNGRLLAYHPTTRTTELLATGLRFANGVALAPDESYLVVAETSDYALRRVWLLPGRRGQSEPFAQNLPGFPDNVTWDSARRCFWVAIGSPRDRVIDALAPHPWLRKVVARLPAGLHPKPKRHAFALAFDPAGRVVDNLQQRAPDSYSPVSSVIAHDGWLYLGSFARDAVARLRF
jgi:sugar lactone lactonase YvrE